MATENAGEAWYALGARDDELRAALKRAETDIKRAGTEGERAFATPMERATGRAAKGMRDVGTAANSLSGRGPKELAAQLDRAETEANQALAAIKQLASGDNLPPTDARKYADALDLKVLDENGKLVTVTMGSYGIGVSRAVAAVAESTHDEAGLCWPREVSPADVHIVATGKDPAVFEAAQRLAIDLVDAGLTVLYDDRRKVSPGIKFTDAELIGVPTIVTVGRGLADGVVELRDRRTDARRDLPVAEAAATIRQAIQA